jgi:hypothetical protein
MLLAVMIMLPLGSAAVAGDYAYDPNLCEAFAYNTNPAFTVPAGGMYRLTVDCSHCGGRIQNYQVTLLSTKHGAPNATLMVLNQYRQIVGVSDAGHHQVSIGNVPFDAVYTFVVMSGSRRSESCLLYCTGAM